MKKAPPTPQCACGAFYQMIARTRAQCRTLIKSGNEQVRGTRVAGKRSQFFASEYGITRDSDRARDGKRARENLGCAGKRIAPCGTRGGEFEWRKCSCVAEMIVAHDRVSNDELPLQASRHRGGCKPVHPLATRVTINIERGLQFPFRVARFFYEGSLLIRTFILFFHISFFPLSVLKNRPASGTLRLQCRNEFAKCDGKGNRSASANKSVTLCVSNVRDKCNVIAVHLSGLTSSSFRAKSI